MTSMSRVATEGSVSGSRLVTQNMLLGLDKGWMIGRGTEKNNTWGLRRLLNKRLHGNTFSDHPFSIHLSLDFPCLCWVKKWAWKLHLPTLRRSFQAQLVHQQEQNTNCMNSNKDCVLCNWKHHSALKWSFSGDYPTSVSTIINKPLNIKVN